MFTTKQNIINNPHRINRHSNHTLDLVLENINFDQSLSPKVENLGQCIDSFIHDRKAQNLSDGTIRFYQTKLKLLTNYLETLRITKMTDISSQIIRDYLIYLEEKGHNPGGIHAAYRALKAFLNWWEGEFEPSNWRNPIKKVKAPKVPEEILEPIQSDEALQLLAVCNTKTLLVLRDCAIILTLMDTGVRASELITMTRKDIDLQNRKLIIRKGKGSKFRIVFFSDKTQQVIKHYLKKREDFSQYLWITKTGTQLQYSGLRQIMRRRAKDAGIEPPSLHSFRRYFALQMLRSGVDIFSLQKLMGHSDIQILRRYLQQTEEDIRSAHQLGGPVNKLLNLS